MKYQTGSNVRLTYKAEYRKSIIADGKELITGNERGAIRVPELKDGNVFIIFKEGITNFTEPTSLDRCFYKCTDLSDYAQIPSDWK